MRAFAIRPAATGPADQARAEAVADEAPAGDRARLGVTGLSVRRDAHGDERDPLGGSALAADTAATLARRRGGGTPLPESVAAPLGEALGADLTGVRVHADGEADRLSRSVQAHAFTYGQDVYFTQGTYSPHSAGGQRLLAHELAHVAQSQTGADAGGSGAGPTIGRADDPAEAAADALADDALASLRRRAAAPSAAPVADADADAAPSDSPLATLRRRAELDGAVVRRGLWNSFKGMVNLYPRVVAMGVSGKELVRITKDGEEAEARGIIAELAATYGIEVSAQATVDAIKAQYSKVLATELQKLQRSVWEMKELRGLRAAVARFAPILGPLRASSTMSDKAQGVTTIGRVKEAIDRNSATGKVERGTMGEYFTGSQNVGLFDTVTDLTDRRYVREGDSGPSNSATLEANAIHEMAHGLIQPTELGRWIAAMAFWTDRYTPSGQVGAEAPPTRYGTTGGAAEDLAESVAIFFINRPGLRAVAPEREAFLAAMVDGWQPAKVEAALDASDKASGGEQEPKAEDASIIDAVADAPPSSAPVQEQGGSPSGESPSGESPNEPIKELSGATP